MDDIKQNGKDISKLSIQRRVDEDNPTSGVYSWWFTRPDDGSIISPWWSEQRDTELREFWKREGNDILQGAVSSMVKKFKSMSWVVEGPNRVANKFQSVLSEAEFGQGWGILLGKTLEDYHTQDKGAFWELIGAGNINGPISGPVLGVAHLDAQYCQLTGDPTYPVLFLNPKDGMPHKLHASRVCHLVDMPSPNEMMNGVGFCAVSRVLASSQVLLKLAQYKNEKLSDLPEAGLLILNNILPHQFENAQANHQRGRRKLGQELWSNIMTLFSLDPAQPASANLVSFANLPEAFNEMESTNLYVNIVALAFGVDVREFWPMTQGALGSARESEVMAQKAKGKGIGDVISTIERAVNWRILPSSVSFRFDFQDDEEDKLKAEINEIKTKTIMSMWVSKPGSDLSVTEPPVTRMELRQMLANNVPEYFKEEFLEIESDESELTDTEREDKGDRIEVDSKGQVRVERRVKRYTRTDEVLAMAEKNYRDGLIGLDDLLEFRLGVMIDDKHPGHANQKVHGHRRGTGEEITGGEITKTVVGNSTLYGLSEIPDAELQVVSRNDGRRAVATFLLPEEARGAGLGQQMLLEALRDGPIAIESTGGVSDAYRRVQQSLVKKGEARIEKDEYDVSSLVATKAFPGHRGRPGQIGGSSPRGGGGGPIPSGISETGEIRHSGIPSRLKNDVDGGIGPSVQYHGTSNQDYTFGSGSDVYLTPQQDEAEGYARDYHRFGQSPTAGKRNREILAIRRKPGAALSIDDEVLMALDEGDDIDGVISQMSNVARQNNYRYLYFSHPSFAGNNVQDVVISLFPKEDLSVVRKQKVR